MCSFRVTFLVGVTMPNPRFESQTKRKLVRDLNLEKAIEKLMTDKMPKFIRKNGEFLSTVIERAKSRHKYQELKTRRKRKETKKTTDRKITRC